MPRFEDLPPADQRAIRAGHAAVSRPLADRPAPIPGSEKNRHRGKWICRQCAATFWSYAKAERHIDLEHRAGRLDWSDR